MVAEGETVARSPREDRGGEVGDERRRTRGHGQEATICSVELQQKQSRGDPLVGIGDKAVLALLETKKWRP
jgi:hypothetical protein